MLPRFAQFLKNYEYDEEMAMSVIDNEAKSDLIGAGVNRYEDFANHLRYEDTKWFIDNINLDDFTYDNNNLVRDFLKGETKLVGMIEKELCLRLFNLIYPSKNEKMVGFAKKMKLYGIKGQRKPISSVRVQCFTW